LASDRANSSGIGSSGRAELVTMNAGLTAAEEEEEEEFRPLARDTRCGIYRCARR
jgi:hypothetical protein